MINKIKNIWTTKGFEICLIIAITVLLLFGLINNLRKKKGTYTSKFPRELSDIFGKDDQNKNLEYKSKTHAPYSKGETECRRVLETIFSKPFPSSRPDFLRNPVTGGIHNLELDCYNEELGLSVEYNGIQHYKFSPYFHRNQDHFSNQKYRDDMKRRICRENGITLIEVPYTVKVPEIYNFLVKECYKHGFIV
jgi:hypothetical protein